ncbi:MAG: toprim domain-containing protein [Candidatus Izemoplasmatales bacterium]
MSRFSKEDIVNKFLSFVEDEFGVIEYVSDKTNILLPICPFCGEERRGKVYFGVVSGWGDCKVGGERFNAIMYVAEYLGVTQKEAFNILFKHHKSVEQKLPSINPVTEEKHKEPVVLPYGELAFNHPYLINRGITNDIIKRYGLLDCKRGKFSGRIIIPIYYPDGTLLTYQGRDYTGISKNKYLFPANFNSKETLFNINYISDESIYVVICEGVFDCLGWVKAGINAVATFGKSISQTQVQILLDKGISNLYLAWDKDAIMGMIDIYKMYVHLFKNIKFILMDKDADECNNEELIELFRQAIDYDWGILISKHLEMING